MSKAIKRLKADLKRETDRQKAVRKVLRDTRKLREAEEEDLRNEEAKLEAAYFKMTGKLRPVKKRQLIPACCLGGRAKAKLLGATWPRCETCACCSGSCSVHSVLTEETPISLSDE